ncbi:MAG: hypothetical protein SPI30_09245 [Prevotella sp.]|nr:hypothetical protein [Prevotella sp.]
MPASKRKQSEATSISEECNIGGNDRLGVNRASRGLSQNVHLSLLMLDIRDEWDAH